MGLGVGDLSKISEGFAAAALDPSRWIAAMDTVTAETGSFGAIILPVKGSFPQVPFSESITGLIDTYFRDGWVGRDERYRGIPTMMRRGAFTDLDFASPEEFRTHPYYQELLAPFNLRWFAGVKISVDNKLWVLAIQRSIEQGPFSPKAVTRLAGISRQLGSAAAIANALGFARAEAALEAFELSGSAVVLVSPSGEVVRVNRTAASLLGPDLQITRGRLLSWQPAATDALNRSLADLIWSPDGAALSAPVVLPRRHGRPILAYAARFAGLSPDAFAPCRAVIVLVDLAAPLAKASERLMQTLGLTRAEARLASLIGSGMPLQAAAAELGIGYETARTELKAVFQKTETNRQVELVSLILTLRSIRSP